MDAVEYIVQKRRLCKGRGCSGCIIEKECRMAKGDRLNAERMVEKVEQWAKDNPAKPVKTRQSEFLKMFPNANRDKDGTLHACPEIFEPEIKTECDGDCHRCKFKRDYWLQEVE